MGRASSLQRSGGATSTRLLDTIEDRHGARQADRVLSIVRKIMNWSASRSDDYTSPIIPGMRRQDPKQQERARILDDDELLAVWRHAEAVGGEFRRDGATPALDRAAPREGRSDALARYF